MLTRKSLLPILALMAWAAAALAAPVRLPNVSAAVTNALEKQGKTDVIVRLDLGPQPSAAAISTARRTMLATMAGVKGWRATRQLESIPYVAGEIDTAGLAALAGNPAVAEVFEDLPLRGALAQSVPAIGGSVAYSNYGLTGSGVVVGLIDTGIDLAHTDLAGAVQASRRFIKGDTNTTNVQDDNGHGTHLAGIITGNGSVAARGVAPSCKLVVIKALNSGNTGFLSDFISGIDWIVTNHAAFPSLKFISLSANFQTETSALCPCDSLVSSVPSYQAFIDAVNRARAAGILIVVPTGNSGAAGLVPPACFNHVVAVGACFDNSYLRAPSTGTYHDYGAIFPAVYNTSPSIQTLAGFSNYGSCLDLVAPGYNITSDRNGGGTLSSFGTSMAVAHVVGTLAILQQRSPSSTAEQLVEVLRANGKSVSNPTNAQIKYPLIDLAKAATKVGSNQARSWTIYK